MALQKFGPAMAACSRAMATAALCAGLCFPMAASAQWGEYRQMFQPRYDRMEQLYADKKYDELLLVMFPEFSPKRGQLLQELRMADVDWLNIKFKAAPASVDFPLYYFMSWMLARSDLEASRTWNARGRIAMMLDGNACATDKNAGMWFAIVEAPAFHSLHQRLRVDPYWAEQVGAALPWLGRTPVAARDMQWYCGPGNVRTEADIATRRADHWDAIKERNDRDLTKK